MPEPPSSPLEGIRVLDFSRLLPGGYLTRLLADLGADVLKVEDTGKGDYARYTEPVVNGMSAKFLFLGQNKRSLSIDLKAQEGREIVRKLARGADVVVESFRPGVMERLELDHARLSETNPRLVFCSLTGYGPTSPHAEAAGHDLNYAALAGALSLNGAAEGAPMPLGVPISDIGVALFAAVGILAALRERDLHGRGRRIDATFLGAAVGFTAYELANLAAGTKHPGRGRSRLTGGLPSYQVYETSDGKHLAVAALEPKFWKPFCERIGRPGLAELDPWNDAYMPDAVAEVRRTMKMATLSEWVSRLGDLDCVTPVLDPDQVPDQEDVRHLGLVTPLEDRFGKRWLVRMPVPDPFGRGAPRCPPPLLGEHTHPVLSELGYSERERLDLEDRGVIKSSGQGK